MKITLNGPRGARTGATIDGKEIVASTKTSGWIIPGNLSEKERDRLTAAAHEKILAEADAWEGEAWHETRQA